MTNRERKYHLKKKQTRTIIRMLRGNIREAIDGEIIRVLRNMANEETKNESDLIPFKNK